MNWKNYFLNSLETKRFQAEDGENLYYRTIGEGHPVVLLHGFGMNNSHWLPFVLNQRGRYQFIIPDLRGFGASRNAYNCYDDVLQRHAKDVMALADYLGLDKFSLMGYSLGGLTSLQIFETYGDDRLTNAILIDIMPRIKPDDSWRWSIFGDNGEKRLLSWRRLTARIMSEIGVMKESEFLFDDLSDRSRFHMVRILGHFMADATRHSWAKMMFRKMSRFRLVMNVLFPMEYWYVFMDHAKSFVTEDYDFREALRKLDIPVSVITGAQSHVFPCESQIEMAQMIPNGSIEILLHSGHVLMLDEPINFYRAMKRGLSRHAEHESEEVEIATASA